MQEKLAMQESPAVPQESLVYIFPGMETIHDRIHRLREARGLSMEQLASAVGVSWQTVQQWENGKTAPKRTRQTLVADALGVTVHELVAGEKRISPTPTVSKPSNMVRDSAQEGVIFHGTPSRPPFYDVPIVRLEDMHLAREIALDPAGAQQHTLSSFGGPSIVAAYMNDDSMTKPDGSGVPSGTLMFIDLDESPRVGHLVVVRMQDGQCYLRQLVSDAGRWKLMPFNPKYEPAPAPDDRACFVGVLKRTRIEQSWTLS